MFWKNTHHRYSTLSIALHWLMFLLLIAVYACIELRELYPKGSDPREALKMWHFMLGLLVGALVIVRVYVKLQSPLPVITPEPATWQMFFAKLGHLGLYALMIAMPLLGWLMLSAAGKPIPFFGLELSALIAENKNLAKTLKEIHGLIGTMGYFLIGIHTIAALYHHYVLKDDTLTRMLPHKKS